ncbi:MULTISPECIES: HlyD family type I secretion periplasmic adaptor subunit [unclassified Mesorhizobium]|uniref:HlyD family type I secretion periplasmic adaptor subunit n=1 Tax=unclassified Mesorhizobium TaxID=325217 RepID=UPI00333B3948
MSNALVLDHSRQQLSARDEQPPSDSARGAVRAGLAILVLFFGGFGTWAAMAPLNGAVVGDAIIKVSGNRKSVQHPQGGVVKEIRVAEGDKVKAGDVLIVLDDVEVRAEFDILTQQFALMRATEARLVSELEGRAAVEFPPDLMKRRAEPYFRTAIEGQVREFETRQIAIEGQEQVLRQRISQLDEEMLGSEGQGAAYQAQLDSVIAEKDSLADLLAKGLITKPRMLQLDRAAAGLQGQIATARSALSRGRDGIGEYQKQITQLQKDRKAEITRELRDIQSKRLDVSSRLQNVASSLARTEVRSPYSGVVVDLDVFSVGGVVGAGARILDVVPDKTSLVVETKIAVQDISDVHPDMAAEVHFTSYKQRLIPIIHGTVTGISADRLVDERTGLPYYVADVTIDQEELAASPQIRLYPGMPATVMITTEERTALDYLIGPLVASFDKAFRQR